MKGPFIVEGWHVFEHLTFLGDVLCFKSIRTVCRLPHVRCWVWAPSRSVNYCSCNSVFVTAALLTQSPTLQRGPVRILQPQHTGVVERMVHTLAVLAFSGAALGSLGARLAAEFFLASVD